MKPPPPAVHPASPWLVPTLVALALCLALLVAHTLVLVVRRRLRRGRIVLRARVAAEGERLAASFLERRGFVVEAAQVAADYALRVDGDQILIGIRADYLVRRAGLRYVVEVKTGALAPRVQTPATRRQLLEYLLAFEVDGVLLLDMSAGTLHEVEFPQWGLERRRRAASPGRALAWGLGAVSCALVVAWALLR